MFCLTAVCKCLKELKELCLTFSVVSSEGDVAPRVGFVHNFKKSEFVVKKWDSAIEDISTTGAHF